MSENTAAEHGVDTRLRVIDDQPLAERAAGYAALHEELAARLESGLSSVAATEPLA